MTSKPNQTKPNNANLPLHIIPFGKSHTKDNAMATSAADFGDHQTKPNQIMHIYPYMIYLFENARLRHCNALRVSRVRKPESEIFMHKILHALSKSLPDCTPGMTGERIFYLAECTIKKLDTPVFARFLTFNQVKDMNDFMHSRNI